MKKNTNQIKKILPIIFTFIIVLTGMIIYKVNNNKILRDDDVNILVATSNYVSKNSIAISDKIDIPVSLLKKQGYLDEDVSCSDDSYVSVKNVDGEYKYEPSLDCENVFIKVTNNNFYNKYTKSMRIIIETILTYEIERSTENRTNQNVEVRIVASEPILEVSGWTLINNNTTLVKIYENNVNNELVTLISAINNSKKEQVNITVDNIDKVKPIVNGVVEGTTYNTDVTINFYKENTKLVAKLNGTIINNNYIVNEDGNYQVVVTDDIGNETIVNFIIDKTAPTVNGIENGGYYNHDVIITFEEGRAVLNNKSFSSGQVVNEEGIYNFVITDNIGNNKEINFTIDKTRPKILNIDYKPTLINNRTNSDVIVEITYDEKINFLDGINTEWKISDENNNKIYKHYSGELDLETEIHDLVSVIDLANNESDKYKLNFVIDKTAPTGIVTANPSTLTNDDVELILETNEDVVITNAESSKVYQYEEGNLRKYAVKRTENGNFTFSFKDIAGNVGSVTYNVENIDKESPMVTDITYSSNLIDGYSKDDVKVTITYNEAIKELPVGYEYVIGSNNQITKLYKGLNNTDTAINEKIKVKDIVGNVNEETIISFTIDKTSPIVNGVENGKYYKKDVTINFNEGNATLNGVDFKNGSVVTEEGNYQLIVRDKALNETTINFVIDKKAPIVTGVEDGKYYKKDVTINFNEGNATLNGVDFKNGSVVTKEENYQLIVRDKALNETIINFVIDKTAPTGIVTANPSTLTNSDVELILETNEDVVITNAESSKVYQYEEGNLRKYAVKRTENGSFTFSFKDKIGNVGKTTYEVKNIDKEVPIVTNITYSSNLIDGYSKDDVKVTITYNEAIKELPVGYEYVIGSNNQITKLYKGLNNADTSINEKIKVKDIVGNVSEEKFISFTIDKTSPIVNGVENGKHYNKDVIINFNEGIATINGINFINGWKVTKEGEYQLIVKDKALNETTINFTIDKVSPIITGVEEGKHYNKNVIVNFNEGMASLNGAEFKNGSTITKEGEYQLIVKDKALNESVINFVIDKTQPNLIVFEKNKNDEIEHYSDFTVNVDYSTADKFNNYRATVSDNFSDNLEIKINGIVDLSKLGSQTIIYSAVDKAGNSSKIIATINVVDNIIPTVEFYISNSNIENDWYNQPIVVNLNSSDIGSGISKYEYRLIIDGIYNDWKEVDYSKNAQFIINENSSNISFVVRSFDKYGNVSLEKNSKSYKIDTVKPNLTYELQNLESSNNWYNSELRFLINPTDNLSGVSNLQYSYSVNGGTSWSEWIDLEIINSSSTLSINEQTDNLVIKLKITDNAKNEFEYIIKDTYKIDTSKPKIMVYSNNNTYTNDFTVTVEANKNGGYKLPEAFVIDNYDKDIEVITSGSVDISKVGKYEVIYSATDDANNVSKLIMTVEVKDTTSPIIKLIGNNSIKVELGHEYIEQGVVIEDNIDNNLSYNISGDIININKIGTYNIIYTTSDNSGNSASVTRIVEVIPTNASGLIEDINKCTSNEDCYVTQVQNNYVWYSGFLWRIIKVNDDGSLKLVTEDSVSGFSYDDSSSDFESSYINNWLNTDFYKSLNSKKDIVVNSQYCIDTLLPTEEYSNEIGTNTQTAIFAKQNIRYNCNNAINLNVGLLTIDEYNILGAENSYLNTKDHFFTMTPSTDKTVWVVQTDGIQKAWNLVSNTYSVRPVITISSDNEFISGNGTINNPYRIKNDESADNNDLLTSRYTGEYVKFGNQIWRIVKTTGTSTKLIMDTYYQTKNDYGMLEYAKIEYGNNGIYAGSNVEKYLNNVVYEDLFNDKEKSLLLKSRWYYNNYTKGIDPLQSLSNQKQYVESYIGLIRIGELMSGTSSTGRVDDFTYWTTNYINDTTNNKYAWFISWAGTSGYAFNRTDIRGVRPVINLNPSLKIKSGEGTSSDPYILNY